MSGSRRGVERSAVLLASLPIPLRDALRPLLEEPSSNSDLSDLRQRLRDHAERLDEQAHHFDFLDVELARTLTKRCEALLSMGEATSDADLRRWSAAAVRYFLLHDDAEPDTSIIGFDDDAAVIAAVERLFHA